VADKQLFINFILVENLNERAIIGTAVLNQYNAHIIDFNKKTIQWSIEGEKQNTSFSENVAENQTSNNNQIANLELIDTPITSITVDQQEKAEFGELINEYRHIFSDNAGLA